MSSNAEILELPAQLSGESNEALEAVLTLKTVFDKWQQLADDLHISVSKRVLPEAGLLELTCLNEKLSIKQKFLNLFAFAAVVRVAEKQDMVMWQRSRFAQELEHQLKNEAPLIKSELPVVGDGFQMEAPVNYYLSQAGINVDTSREKVLISDRELLEILFASNKSLRVVA